MPKKSLPVPIPAKAEAAPVGALPDSGRVVAFIVGIETYQATGKVPKVEYAHNDAEAFAEVLQSIYPESRLDLELYLDSDATLSNLAYLLPQTIGGLGADDLFIFYYAGHGYHGVGGNRITAWDSHAHEPENTTLLLSDILIEPLAISDCQRALAFVDACGTPIKPAARDVLAEMDRAELGAFLSAATYSTVFLACGAGQKSYPSAEFRHGVWTYFLLKALRGEASDALGPGRYITDTSLQNYLALEVPAYVRRGLNVRGQQRPSVLSRASHTFQIRHVPEPLVIAPPEGDFSQIGASVTHEFFERIETGRVRSLPGFIKGTHSIFPKVTERTNSFVTGLLNPQIDEELQDLYRELKRTLGLKRRDVVQECSGGQGSLDTDLFRFWIETRQDDEDPEDYRIARRLEFRDGAEDEIGNLDAVFGAMFDRIVVKFDQLALDFDALAGFFEDIEDEYGGEADDDLAKQTVTYTPVGGPTIRIDLSRKRLTVSGGGRDTPADLLTLARKISIGAAANQRLLK